MNPLCSLSSVSVLSVKVGDWRLLGRAPAFHLESDSSSENVLYAFVSEDEVLYRPLGSTPYALSPKTASNSAVACE
jgi:hypothetical protein